MCSGAAFKTSVAAFRTSVAAFMHTEAAFAVQLRRSSRNGFQSAASFLKTCTVAVSTERVLFQTSKGSVVHIDFTFYYGPQWLACMITPFTLH